MTVTQWATMLIAAAWLIPASAQDTARAEECISLMQLDHVDVVDDQTILFCMKGKGVYRNSLPSKCPGLLFEDQFMYRVTLNQLCNIDVITVLHRAGFGLTEGPSCRIGRFEPISRALAKKLKTAGGAEEK
jgi:hypothetical protein